MLPAVQLSTLLQFTARSLFSSSVPILLETSRRRFPYNTNMYNPNTKNNEFCLLTTVSLELAGLCVVACFRVRVFTELEQGALGGVFCYSWGATVLSPNRSLVPAVVPGEGI